MPLKTRTSVLSSQGQVPDLDMSEMTGNGLSLYIMLFKRSDETKLISCNCKHLDYLVCAKYFFQAFDSYSIFKYFCEVGSIMKRREHDKQDKYLAQCITDKK